jgi:hypothetical protein
MSTWTHWPCTTAPNASTFFLSCLGTPSGQAHPSLSRVQERIHTQHSTLNKTPPDEWSAELKHLYLTTHNTHNTRTSMPPAEFEPGRLQTHVLHRAVTGIRTSAHTPNKLHCKQYIQCQESRGRSVVCHSSVNNYHCNRPASSPPSPSLRLDGLGALTAYSGKCRLVRGSLGYRIE